MRLFIAIPLPSCIKEEIAQLLEAFKKCDLAAKWVAPGNLHMTLKFLGEVGGEKIDEVKKVIENVVIKFNSLAVDFKDFGFFPNERRPRVFFVSTSQEEKLCCLAQVLEDKLKVSGFSPEGRFKPHITLARIKDKKNIERLKKEMKNIHFKKTFLVQEIILFKSTLTKTGPIYEEIFKANLRK